MADAANINMNSPIYFLSLLVITVLSFLYFLRTCFRNVRSYEVILVTRYPVAGKAKTRLIPSLGAKAAAKLQVKMTEHMLHRLEEVKACHGQLKVTVLYKGGTDTEMKYWLDRQFHILQCDYRLQADGDLGVILTTAVKDSFKAGTKNVIVIGADIPGINREVLDEGFKCLTTPGVDMVLGPAEDGGYYLVGFNTQAETYIDEIFKDMTWGVDTVFEKQMARAKHLKASVSVLPYVLQDVDTEEDISVFEHEVGIDRHELCDSSWSIIIPTLNEEHNIIKCLQNIAESACCVSNILEILVCDGGSADDTLQKVEQFNSSSPIVVKALQAPSGRGNQLIFGADMARGLRLLFLHADSRLPPDFDTVAEDCLDTPGVVAGAFNFYLDVLADRQLKESETSCYILQMKLLVWGTHKRCHKYEKPYGDQGLFLDRRTYRLVGGFPHFYLMEDYILGEKLRTVGHIRVVEEPMVTSHRRFKQHGWIKITGFNQLVILAYHLGVHPDTLAKWYYGNKLKIKHT